MSEETAWRKSSLSGMNGCVEVAWRRPGRCQMNGCVEVTQVELARCNLNGCVEVCTEESLILVRDSKLGDESPILRFDREEWAELVKAIKDGEYDDLVRGD